VALGSVSSPAEAWDVSHRVKWWPGGNVVPQVEWRHREFARSRQASPPVVDLCDPGLIVVAGPPLGLSTSLPNCTTAVGSTFANGYASINLVSQTAIPNPYVEAVIRSWGNVRAKVDNPPFTTARAVAESVSIVRARGGRDTGRGRIRWSKNWRSSGVRGGAGWARDPIVMTATPVGGGPTLTTTLMSIEGHVTKGTISWMNNTITVAASRPGVPGGPPAHARLDVVMDSPYTVQQGTIRLEVRDGVVIFSEATGIWAGVAVPPVGATSSVFSFGAPDETQIDYDLNLPPGDHDVGASMETAGREEDADGAGWVCPPTVTDLGEGFNMADTSTVGLTSTVFGYSIAAPFTIAFPVRVPGGEIWIPQGVTLPFYQTNGGSSGPIAIYCRMWRGNPAAGGIPIAGDMIMDRYAGDAAEGAYRVTRTTLLNNQRVIRSVTGQLDGFPQMDSFFDVFFEVSLRGNTALPGPFTPPSIPYQASVPNTPPMLQYNAQTLQWVPLLEQGRPVSIPFVLHVHRIILCRADLNGDGIVDFNDLLEYLNLYNDEDPDADLNGDGIVDFNDLLEYLNLYNQGC